MSTSIAHLRTSPFLLLGAGLALGDLFVWDASPGLGAALAVLALALLPVAARRNLVLGAHLRFMASLVLAVVVGLALTGATVGLMLAPLVLALWTAALDRGPEERFLTLLPDGLVGLVMGGWQALANLVRLQGVRSGAGWVLPVVLTGAFAALLGVANPLIADVWSRLGDYLAEASLPEVGRVGLWLVLGAIIGAVLLRRTVRPLVVEAAATVQEGEANSPLRFLLLANVLFAVQHILDLRYLVGGASLPEGMTYAGYAHRGAYPLIATVLLAAVVVLVWFRPGSPAERDPRTRTLVLAWLAQNALLVLAAAWRLHLYVDAYGLSRWRVATAVWMAVVVAGLLAMAWRIIRLHRNAWLANATAMMTAVVLALTTWIPVDVVIAWHNVQHCREVGQDGFAVDVEYLEHLDASAAPALAWLAAHSRDGSVAIQAADVARMQAAILAERRRTWRGWTVLGGP